MHTSSLLRPRTVHLLAMLAFLGRGQAQVFTITQPAITTCTGAFLDSGGQGASGYSNNESYVSTICSDQPGQAISLTWVTFNLSTVGPDPIDQLVIYDGPDVSAPVIGTYDGNNAPGIVSASFANTSGCLTVQFTSNSSGTGVFAANITCYVPCDPPLASAVMGEPAPARICQGESVQFNGSASTAASGHTLSTYRWYFGDGAIDSTSGPITSHAFQAPGEYVVELVLTDDNGCHNDNQVDLHVWVSTTPTITLPEDTTVCQGTPVQLAAQAHANTWTAQPVVDFGDGIPLPDLQGVPFNTSITFNSFAPGATLQNISQLLSVCVDMEHSFMGDLVIQITCPNSQTVIMHQQGGSGTFIGDANDADDIDPVPGTCWHYCWSPSATNGTWEENSSVGSDPHLVMASQGESLQPGTYESVQPFSNLLGCPLNGTWTFTVTDLWAIDNGFICSWGLDFDPALYPDLTEFTPTLGLSTPDSSWWSGPSFTPDGSDHLQGTVVLGSVGTSEYVFHVTDNFGCTYTDTTHITTTPGPAAAFNVAPPSPQEPGVSAQFTDATQTSGGAITSWHWVFGAGIPDSYVADPLVVFDTPGDYPVTLTVTTADGCSSTVARIYVVRPVGDVFVPNVFSPNGDGENDRLEFSNVQYFPHTHLQVFNRWGQVIFDSPEYQNTWTATGVPDGTYYFILQLEDGRKWAGPVTILR